MPHRCARLPNAGMDAQQQSPGSEGGAPSTSGRSPTALVISINRVKGLVREDAGSISTEACFAIAKATELLIESIAERAAAKMAAAGRDSLEYADVAAVVAESPALDLLADIVPQTPTALKDRYQAYITQQSLDWDKMESVGWLAGALIIFLACIAKGILRSYFSVFMGWFLANCPSAFLPGLVALTLPSFYERQRETVVVASKLLAAASYPYFRFSWHAPGVPSNAKAAFGSVWARLPVHPIAAVQCGAVTMLALSIRHSLRFKAQLLCQLAMLVVAMQAEAAVRRTAGSRQQHFLSLRNATLLQLVCGTLWPLVQHYQFDARRRKMYQQVRRRQQQQQEEEQQHHHQHQEQAQQEAGQHQLQSEAQPARRRRQSE
ncbi:Nuclear transcription factor Y subunit C-2 [Chlorella sorokiniana]|uniref:Nuclear transcription factor Y subunit C-2 n=1 Tax=Chlorella sorokiniana TaxID=3076 RepID=A0A2P6TSE1_CHLSO|nr:Nuclear transcription factor Y subunit C-2 [Chlorella sorokiniana]|eukprot:PRW56964.1 Nuclear transcription factor Y subunit C-2 [Chlorella sorokiniana]